MKLPNALNVISRFLRVKMPSGVMSANVGFTLSAPNSPLKHLKIILWIKTLCSTAHFAQITNVEDAVNLYTHLKMPYNVTQIRAGLGST